MIWIYIVTWFVCMVCEPGGYKYEKSKYGLYESVYHQPDTCRADHSKHFLNIRQAFDFMRDAPKGENQFYTWVENFKLDSLKMDSSDAKWIIKMENEK